jgi:two-component system, OmpR family, sensor histidine kinase KdpD
VSTERGRLRVYLGAAPGVGKTVAMLSEGRRRAERGTDVVVGIVEDHGRTFTKDAIGELAVLPRLAVQHRGIELTEMDVDAIVRRRPQLVLVDELAHTNAPGSPREKRWQDVDVILDAGIDVVTTVNVQHLESLRDVVARITGIVQQETVPDAVVRQADAIELVDMSPQALRRRMAHGHIYPAERIDTALGNYFREGNLTALRELALLWVADRVDEGLERYRGSHDIRGTWAARERIVVALTGGPEGDMLLRRGARIAGRVAGRSLVGVHVVRSDGTAGAPPAELERQRLLVEQLGGTLQLVVGDDIPAAILDFARSVNGTQIVVGGSSHGRFAQLVRSSTMMSIVRGSGDIDVHVVTHPQVLGTATPLARRKARHPLLAWPSAVLGPAALAALLLPWRTDLNLTTVLLIFSLGVLGNALVGGVLPAALSAVIAGILANLLYTPPYGSLTIQEPANAFSLLVFLIVGVTVASIVDRSRARSREAEQGRAEAQLLAAVGTGAVQANDPLHAVLDRARIGFAMDGVGVFTETGDPIEVLGTCKPLSAADVSVPAGDGRLLALFGHPLPASQHRLVEVFGAQAALADDRMRLAREEVQAQRLRQADSVRTAVLAALSHDLRTPLATIKAAVAGLRDPDVPLPEEDRAELLDSTAAAADQLDGLLANLLDMSRLQTGVLQPVRRPVSVDEVVHRALVGLPRSAVRDDLPDDLPLLDTDAGLLERVVANVVTNAVRHSPAGKAVRLIGGVVADRVQLRVVDHGPGVPEEDRERMFAPFQRLGDAPGGNGLGLGLAVARGLAEAVETTIEVDDTPGGGLTVVISVPLAAVRSSGDVTTP